MKQYLINTLIALAIQVMCLVDLLSTHAAWAIETVFVIWIGSEVFFWFNYIKLWKVLKDRQRGGK